jgi:hypothetical protein
LLVLDSSASPPTQYFNFFTAMFFSFQKVL